MKIIRNAAAAVAYYWRSIHLIDKCLIVIMVILLMQSGGSLLINMPESESASQIDAVLRTSAAAIFGYFISANFCTSGKQKSVRAVGGTQKAASDTSASDTSAPAMRGQIGFGTPPSEVSNGIAATDDGEATPSRIAPCRAQILVVAGIGVVSLLILIAARDIAASHPGVPALLSQLRDFVSGSVGFLVGTPTGNER